jgi:HPt (histidine-containing phosphotransfer) domain-containing protein
MTHRPDSHRTEKALVYIDPDLEPIVPGFLENRRKDVDTIGAALMEKDWKTVRLLGHRMKGDGGGYGLEEISRIGDAIEQAAMREDRAAIERQTAALASFLEHVKVVYRISR